MLSFKAVPLLLHSSLACTTLLGFPPPAAKAGEVAAGLPGEGVSPASAGSTAADSLPRPVPFLAQSPLLCGGAAAAMVERFWGRKGVYGEDFRHLVRPAEGGIRFSDLLGELGGRGWEVAALADDPEGAATLVHQGIPVIALFEPDPGTLHYVVLVQWTGEDVAFHDPALRPDLVLSTEIFLARWQKTGYRGIVLLPPPKGIPGNASRAGDEASTRTEAEEMEREEDDSGGEPRLRDPLVRDLLLRSRGAFDDRRYDAAAELAREAADRDPDHAAAWRLLAASAFLRGRPADALRAWNRAGLPPVDLVQVRGASALHHTLVLARSGLEHRATLTPARLRLATRRTNLIPTVQRARSSYVPNRDGSVEVRIHVMERDPPWRSWPHLAAATLRGLAHGPVRISVPELLGAGRGHLLTVAGQWSSARPQASLAFSAPAPPLPGIVSVRGSWSREAYASTAGGEVQGDGTSASTSREVETARLALSVKDWIHPSIRGEARLHLDRWEGRGRFAGLGGEALALLFREQVGVRLGAAGWKGTGRQEGFSALEAEARWRSHLQRSGWIHTELRTGVVSVTEEAPKTLWPGAGIGMMRPYLLRAHPLEKGGRLRGDGLSRRLLHAGLEISTRAWLVGPARIRPGAFLDAATGGSSGAIDAVKVDAGGSLLVSVPGSSGHFEISVARGLTDGAGAFSLAWRESWWPSR